MTLNTKTTILFFFSLIISNLLRGQNKEFEITPITAYKAYYNLNRLNEYGRKDKILIFNMQLKMVDYPIYGEEDIPSKKYQELKEELPKYKGDYDEFQEKKSIAPLIEKYLTSNEKRKIKLQYLVEAEKIVEKYKNELRKTYSTDNGAKVSFIYLDKEGENRNDKILEFYKDFINNKLQMSSRAKKYLEILDQLNNTSPTDKKPIFAGQSIKKEVFVIDTTKIHFSKLDGTFELIPLKYKIIKHKKSNTLPLEVISTSDNSIFPNDKNLVSIENYEYSVLKNINSDDYFLVTQNFLNELTNISIGGEIPFTFVRQSALKLEKDKGIQYISGLTEIEEKRILGMYPIQEIGEEPDYETSKYLKFTSIPTTDRFIMITDCPRGYGKVNKNLVIQNIKTQQLYLVSSFPIREFQDLDNMTNESLGRGFLTMDVPKELTPKEKQSVQQYHSMLKTAYQKGLQLRNIQKKYLTRTGLFDPSRATATDKATYNRILKELKAIYSKMREMTTNSSGTRDVIENSLSTEDAGALDVIAGWYYSYDI